MATSWKTFIATVFSPTDANLLMKWANVQVDSGSVPPTRYEGQTTIDTTNNQRKIYDGGADVVMEGWGPWKPWSPTVTGISFTSGSLVGRYQQMGKLCHVMVEMVIGSAPTFAGSGGLTFVAPFTSGGAGISVLSGYAYDASAGTYYSLIPLIGQPSNSSFQVFISGAGQINSGAPFTWTTSDYLNFSGVYEIA